MKISYDKDVDAMKIKFNDKPYNKSQEIIEGVVIDLTVEGEIIALEVLYVSQREINPYEIVCHYHPALMSALE